MVWSCDGEMDQMGWEASPPWPLLPKKAHTDSSTSPALRAKTLLRDHPLASRRWTPQCFVQVTQCFVAIPGCSCSEVRQWEATGWDVAPGESCCPLTAADGTRGTRMLPTAHAPLVHGNVMLLHPTLALQLAPNFLPRIKLSVIFGWPLQLRALSFSPVLSEDTRFP